MFTIMRRLKGDTGHRPWRELPNAQNVEREPLDMSVQGLNSEEGPFEYKVFTIPED